MFLQPERLAAAIRYEGGFSRRLFLSWSASLAALPTLARTATAADRPPQFSSQPFTLGVASGDPAATSVLLWTRLAPAPLEPQGGLGVEAISVRWEVAHDDKFTAIVAKGTAVATPQLGHSVHVEVQGLEPNRWYFYRFQAGDATSPIGRTRTLPAPGELPGQLKFAHTSCQHFEQGLFTAYEHMVRDELDLVFHLGDYIYEYAGKDGLVRKHVGHEIESLGDYRVRLSQYRSDPLLHGMHAACPWLVTWDDHEFDNNCANETSEEPNVDPVAFLLRRTNAYQAYYEMMPLRARSLPQGPDMQLYRKASFGRLAELLVLDTRQYRSDQPNNDRASPLNDAALNPTSSLLGRRQRGWLERSLLKSQATWNVLAQQVMMGMVEQWRAGKSIGYSMDQWPGYAFERRELVKFLADRRVPNPVVLTGDIHENYLNELRVDDRNTELPVVATELVATSLSSGGNGSAEPKGKADLLSHNPGVKFYNNERGYVRNTLTSSEWRVDFVAVDDVLKPGGKCFNRASFVIEAGQPGAKPA
jgi:alkaline phosphatase D